jgi:hypothetical protein
MKLITEGLKIKSFMIRHLLLKRLSIFLKVVIYFIFRIIYILVKFVALDCSSVSFVSMTNRKKQKIKGMSLELDFVLFSLRIKHHGSPEG